MELVLLTSRICLFLYLLILNQNKSRIAETLKAFGKTGP